VSAKVFQKIAAGLCDAAQMTAAFDVWWSKASRLGDPIRRPNLIEEAFAAGFLAGQQQVAAAVQAERAAASGSRPVAWSEFDYASPPDGLCWVEVERPETWCDVDYQGRSVGGYTGETTVVVVLTEISMTSHGPDFGVVGSGDFGRVDHDDRVVRFLSLTAPPDTSALAEAVGAARDEGRIEGATLGAAELAEAIEAAVIEERVACAQIAQNRESEGGEYALAARHIAAAIRARFGGKEGA